MAPPKNKPQKKPGPNIPQKLSLFHHVTLENAKKLILDPHCIGTTCIFLFLVEVILNIFIIERVNYTEIDWKAYMQEVEGFLNGTVDYSKLKGDTGPLVYPAGFVYIYTIFYYVTSRGTNIYLAQYIYLVLYLIQTALNFRILTKTLKVPPYALLLTTLTSYRMHSIFVLRLFNDPIAVLLFYVSLNLFISNRWILGSIFYSLAVSVKMNIILYAPCLLIAYLTNLTYFQTVLNLFICGFIQLFLGLPFIYGNFWAYVKGSFDLSRVFEHKWTVNYRFLSRELFENRILHVSLLVVHISLLFLFVPLLKRYLSSYAKLNIITEQVKTQLLSEKQKRQKEKSKQSENLSRQQKQFLNSFEKQLKDNNVNNQVLTDDDVFEEQLKVQDRLSKICQLFILPFFVTNLIGIACARSLHYQFYCWYFHSLLYLAFSTGYRKPVVFLILGVIEFCWNTYPSTEVSSGLLHLCHVVLLYGVYRTMKL